MERDNDKTIKIDEISPWRFLSPFEEGSEIDRAVLQETRRDELRIVTDMVLASRISLLYAISGNGKSSLVNAGLVPNIEASGYAVYRTRPRPPWSLNDPCHAFKDCILKDLRVPLVTKTDIEQLATVHDLVKANGDDHLYQDIHEWLTAFESKLSVFSPYSTRIKEKDIDRYLKNQSESTLREFMRELAELLGRQIRIIIICDQFEELFVHYGNMPQLDNFVHQLGEIWADDSLDTHLLFSMREDWVGSMIAFRRAIPEIFRSYFKLSPLRRSCAKPALLIPLSKFGLLSNQSEVTLMADRLIDDLVDCYGKIQRARIGYMALEPSPSEDPYIELPALQIVADRLWQTRNHVEHPFTTEHYEHLDSFVATDSVNCDRPDSDISPAELVLERYLPEQLDQIEDDTTNIPEDVWRALRLDCLYALTDGSAHRRALRTSALEVEANRLKQSELDLPRITPDFLPQLLDPLLERRLIRETTTRSGEKEYELSHDYEVRSVIRNWKELDRVRTAELAVRKRRSEIEKRQLKGFAANERLMLRWLQILPFVGLLTLILLVVVLFTGMVSDDSPVWVSNFSLSLVGAALVMFIGIGWIGHFVRHKWSQIVGFGACGLIVVWWFVVIALTPFAVSNKYDSIPSEISFQYLNKPLISSGDMKENVSLNEIVVYPFVVEQDGILAAKTSGYRTTLYLTKADGSVVKYSQGGGQDGGSLIVTNVSLGEYAWVITSTRTESGQYMFQVWGEGIRTEDPNKLTFSPKALERLNSSIKSSYSYYSYSFRQDKRELKPYPGSPESSQGAPVKLVDLQRSINGYQTIFYPLLIEDTGILEVDISGLGLGVVFFIIDSQGNVIKRVDIDGKEGGQKIKHEISRGLFSLVLVNSWSEPSQYELQVGGQGISNPMATSLSKEASSAIERANRNIEISLLQNPPALKVKVAQLVGFKSETYQKLPTIVGDLSGSVAALNEIVLYPFRMTRKGQLLAETSSLIENLLLYGPDGNLIAFFNKEEQSKDSDSLIVIPSIISQIYSGEYVLAVSGVLGYQYSDANRETKRETLEYVLGIEADGIQISDSEARSKTQSLSSATLRLVQAKLTKNKNLKIRVGELTEIWTPGRFKLNFGFLRLLVIALWLLGISILIPTTALSVGSICRRLDDSLTRSRTIQLLGAELVDFASLVFLVFVVGIGSRLIEGPDFHPLYMSKIIALLGIPLGIIALVSSVWLLVKVGGTPGLLLVRLGVVGANKQKDSSRPLEHPSFFRALRRQVLYMVWLFSNVLLGLPWLIGTPLIVRKKGRNLYDLLAGTSLAEAKRGRKRDMKAN